MGAARLLRGLARVVAPKNLTVIVNTGDDEEFFGLHVSPDLDTIVYTLADVAPRVRGWGIRGDTFNAKGALDRFYDTPWFQLGDRDLATNLFRTDALRNGRSLADVTAEICKGFGIGQRVLPVTNDRVRTMVDTHAAGVLPFQEYLVKHRGRPRVKAVRYRGATRAEPAPGVLDAIAKADVVVVAPSNPFVSVGPILAVRGVRAALRDARDRTVGVSPLIGGRAVKGPLASMLRSMGYKADSRAISAIYRGVMDCLVVAPGDAASSSRAAANPDSPTNPKARLQPRMVERDILIRSPEAAASLAAFALAQIIE